MSRRQVRGDGKLPDAKRLAVAQQLDARHLRNRGDGSVLRVVATDAGLGHDCRAPRAGNHRRAAPALQFRKAPGMVEVDVRIHNQLHVLRPKAQRTNAGGDWPG